MNQLANPKALSDAMAEGSPWDERQDRPVGRSLLVHQRVEQQALRAPEATAVRFLERELSYDELNRRANRLARYLRERGVRAGDRVVVCIEPSLDIAVALVGILKAGAVYVPVDPGYPPARMRAILEETRPATIIAEEPIRLKFELAEQATLSLGELPAPDSGVERGFDYEVSPEQPASIFYTSGSTGAPKGVVGSHANLEHYVRVAERRYGIEAGDVMPALARFSFSISLFELLTPLVTGATLHVLPRAEVIDPKSLSRALSQVTIFHAGPSLLKGLIAYIRREYADFDDFSGVKHASSGGDMVPPEVLEGLKEIFSNAEVFVIYGCSEISCMGCTYSVPREQRVVKTYVGKAFEDVTVRVLDAKDRELPAGEIGEIHFAGKGVTLGYLDRPELTAEKFLLLDGQRFYRTGDTGRVSEDGWLEMLGRSDFQVKIRGMRVELSEVESTLRRAPGVRDAVAGARTTADGEKMLVAYVVPEPAVSATPSKAERISAIRAHVLEQLPDYMVPAVYVELERLPLNFNLKLDRRALPEPTEADFRALGGDDPRAPTTDSERVLASLFQQSLKLERIGLDDNFFELGGDSLLAVQFCLGVETALGVKLEGMDLLREPLEVLARLCDRKLGKLETPTRAEAPRARSVERVETFHFGQKSSLYGVLHGRTGGRVETAALLCGPVGQEAVRSRFVLKKLTKRLSALGIPSLLFDYFGCGDSLGDSAAASATRWRDDIGDAADELRRRTGATRVVAVGVRLGALLLGQAASRVDARKLVLWDPVRDGAAHFDELRRMQRAYLRGVAPLRFWSFRFERTPPNELLGTSYSESTLRELGRARLEPLLSQHAGLARCFDAEADCAWSDLARLEDVLPDPGISAGICAMLTEAP